MSFESLMARRYLRARRKQAFISVITLLSMAGVALGVCALIVVLSVMGGFERELKNKILGLNAHLTVFRMGSLMADYPQVSRIISQDPEVAGVTPYIHGQVMVVTSGGASGLILRALDLPSALDVFDLAGTMVRGRVEDLLTPADDGIAGIIVGAALARRLALVQGSIIHLINPLGDDSPVGRIPQNEPFRVVGLFESGMYQYDVGLGYVDLKTAQDFLGMGDYVQGAEIKLKDSDMADVVGSRLIKALGPSYYVRDWMSTNYNLFAAIKLEKITMFIILTLIVLVAAFGIISSLIMLVMEKTRDIGVLKAMGASNASIQRIFLLEGTIIGVAGTAVGLVGGLILCELLARYQFIELPKDIYSLSTLPVLVDPWMVLLVAASSIIISILATIYPSRTAGRLHPVEALRYQ